jgi:hypothetical protein
MESSSNFLNGEYMKKASRRNGKLFFTGFTFGNEMVMMLSFLSTLTKDPLVSW